MNKTLGDVALIAIFAYNRPAHLKKTIESLSANTLAKQSKLIIFCDGAKGQDDANVLAVREIAKQTNGFASVHVVEQEINIGLVRSIVQGIAECFSHVDRLIVLEDDIVVAKNFLDYINQALDLYQNEQRVGAISAFNFCNTPCAKEEAYFLWQSTSWGWATWRDRWQLFEENAESLLTKIEIMGLQDRFNAHGNYPFSSMLNEVRLGLTDSWAIRWYASLVVAERLTLFPACSFVRNIGADGSGVHCDGREDISGNSIKSNINDQEINFSLPKTIEIDYVEEKIYHNSLRHITKEPRVLYSYAQNYEDIYLQRAFSKINKGYYIDVGAAWPIFHSVTWLLYTNGWSGINIEPIPSLNEQLSKVRARDINLAMIASDQSGSIPFFESSQISSSTASVKLRGKLADFGTIKSYDVEAKTLTSICDIYCKNKDIHVLKIDAEGFEHKVLQGLDLKIYRPWLIVVESTANESYQLDLSAPIDYPIWEDWEHILICNNYDFVFFDGINRWYVAAEHDDIGEAFQYPVRAIDNIITPSQENKNRVYVGLQYEINIAHKNILKITGELENAYKVLQKTERNLSLANYDLSQKNQAIQNNKEQISNLSNNYSQLLEDVKNKEYESQTIIRGKDEAIDMLQRTAQDLSSNIVSLKCTLHDKDIFVSELKATIYSKDEAIDMLQRTVEDFSSNIVSLKCTLHDKEAFVSELKATIYNKDETIHVLQNMAQELNLSIAEAANRSFLVIIKERLGHCFLYLKTKIATMIKKYVKNILVQFSNGNKNIIINKNIKNAQKKCIGIDCLQLCPGVSGGVEIYMEMLTKAICNQNEYYPVLICTSKQYKLYKKQFGDSVGYRIHTPGFVVSLVEIMSKLLLRKNINIANYFYISFSDLKQRSHIDILHSPVQIFSRDDFHIPAVLNLHDLQHLHLPENFTAGDIEARNILYPKAAALAGKIIASSRFVADDIVSHGYANQAKVVVIPVTWNPSILEGASSFAAQKAREIYSLPEQYLFYPAQFWAHKNHWRLVEALSLVRQHDQGKNMHLVLTGNRKFSGWDKAYASIKAHGLQNIVHCLNRVPTEHLAGLYLASTFCVVPSTFEASSYPVIEAQLLGCPVMCSNITSLPELVANGAGRLFDPWSVESIAEAILDWIKEPKKALEAAKIAKIKVWAEHSQEAYAKSIAALYAQLLHEQELS